METEIIDKLFLELSQITTAKTKKEINLEAQTYDLAKFLINGFEKRGPGTATAIEMAKRLLREHPDFKGQF